MKHKGIQIGAHDLIIGSTALSLGFSVVTFNQRHYKKIEGLKVETLVRKKIVGQVIVDKFTIQS